jgi:hypothetical protein
MNKIICQYVNDRKGRRVGCVVGVGRGQIGWSLCNLKSGDRFDKETARNLAIGRAVSNPVADFNEVPQSLRKVVRYFVSDRSVKYFKQA